MANLTKNKNDSDSGPPLPLENREEYDFIDIDEEELDLLYLQNSLNYHSNRINFWQNTIINKLRIVQKSDNHEDNIDTGLLYVELSLPNIN